MTAAYRAFKSTRFFGSLDGLRALSILSVIWIHTWFNTPQFQWLLKIPVLHNGPNGVDVFFTISGFLITTLLIREREKYGKISLKDFYIRRALRIWPLYYAVLLLYVGMILATERGTSRGAQFFHYLPGYLTYTYTWFRFPSSTMPPFNFAWSLSTEEQFYLFWPCVMVAFRRYGSVLVMLLGLSIRLAAGLGMFNSFLPADSLAMRIIQSICVPICLGALLAVALDHPQTFQILYTVLGQKSSAIVGLVLLLLAVGIEPQTLPPLFWLGLITLVGACVIREDNGLARILRFKLLALIGTVSYGMYLFNTLVVLCLRPALGRVGIHHPAIAYPFTVAATTLLAWLSYRYFESPFLSLKKRFSRVKPADRTPAHPPTAGS